jgi:hypothetical protein
MNLKNKLEKIQTTTWITHSIGAALVPFTVALFVPIEHRWNSAVGTSLLILSLFVFKEEKDELAHKRGGDWRTPDDQNITPLVDKYGDLLGPAVATVVYCLTWILTII